MSDLDKYTEEKVNDILEIRKSIMQKLNEAEKKDATSLAIAVFNAVEKK
jgi:hypothetical protein